MESEHDEGHDNFEVYEYHGLCIRYLICSGCCGVVYMISSQFVQATSRRLANLAFITLTAALCTLSLGSVTVIDFIYHPRGLHLPLLSALSENQLVVFLVANLATGAVNFSIQTLRSSDSEARVILLLYMTFLCTFSLVFSHIFRSQS